MQGQRFVDGRFLVAFTGKRVEYSITITIGYNGAMSEILLQKDEYNQVAQKVVPGGQLRRAWRLKGGISAGMVALEIETAVGHTRRIIIRQYSDAHHRQNPQIAAAEYRLLQITQAQGLATPAPYFCGPGHRLSLAGQPGVRFRAYRFQHGRPVRGLPSRCHPGRA